MSEQLYQFQFRAFSDIEYKRAKHPKIRLPMSGRHVLIDDTETATDYTQRLLFGSGRLMVDCWDGNTLTCRPLKVILYYADDLPTVRPKTFNALNKVASERGIDLVSHTEYLRNYFLKCGYADVTSEDYQPGTIAGYNISFDIYRHGMRVTEPRGVLFRNGLGCEFLNEPWAPYYRETRAGIGMRRELTRRQTGGKTWHPPVVVDVAELVRAMTGKPHSLLSAGKAFKCDVLKFDMPEVHDPEINYQWRDLERQIRHYIEYNLQDVAATADLYSKVMTRFYRHPIRLRPEACFSPASFSKQYLRDMGVHAAFCTCPDCKPKCTCVSGCSICDECKQKRRCVCDTCKLSCACDVHHLGMRRRGAWGVSHKILGAHMAAFLGARSEAGIRLLSVPGVLWDWKSMYPTIMILTGLWELIIAERIEVREETSSVQEFLDRVTLADLFKPETWLEMRGVAEFHPYDDLIPVRIAIGETSAIATKYVQEEMGDPPLCSPIADLVASKIRTGKTPQIVTAYRSYPLGRQSTLKPIKFAGRLEFDPRRDNWFRFLVNQREAIKRDGDPYDEELGLKLTNNSNYGIFVEMNMSPGGATVYGLGGESWEVRQAEQPGEFSNPLLAPVITSGARLMLAMFQSLAGPHIFCDTDSYCVPATPDGIKPDGCEVDVLSWDRVQEIAERFDTLNPYDPELVPRLIEWQQPGLNKSGSRDPLLVSAVSAKRYAMYRMKDGRPKIVHIEDGDDDEDDGIEVVKRSEHGLGLYLSPYAYGLTSDDNADDMKNLQGKFYDEVWTYGILTHVFRREVPEPRWFDLPAVSRFPVKTRHTLKAFSNINEGIPYYDQVIPGNFFLAVHRPRVSLMWDANTPLEKLRLVAPFTTDPSSWLNMDWMDVGTGRRYPITTDPDKEVPGEILLVKTYRDVVYEYFTHPEMKYDGPDGKPCGMHTRGILQPGTAIPESYGHVAKDSSSVNTSVEAFEHKGRHVYHTDSRPRLMAAAREVLKAKGVGRVKLQLATGISEKAAQNFIMSTVTTMQPHNWAAVLRFAQSLAKDDLRENRYLSSWLHTPREIFREWKSLVKTGHIIPIQYKAPPVCDDFTLVSEDVPEEEW